MTNTDTICAIATPPGTGGIGILRVSGPLTRTVALEVLGREPEPRRADFAHFLDDQGGIIDSGIALLFPSPASFTGEDVLELQGHGGLFVMQQLMQRVIGLGARAARPGEFSERAFLNDKLDLAQAEAIADLISSGTYAAARAAQRSLQGVFSRRVDALQQTLEELRVFVEAAIDFPDEEVDFLAESDIVERVEQVVGQVHQLLNEARQGRLLRDGITMAIVGRPNAGKSSLLNALSGEDSAIVTEIPGTTRDVLHEYIDLDGIPVHVVDTAGIRDTEDPIEAEGVRRARDAVHSADLALILEDASQPFNESMSLLSDIPEGVARIRVANKVDLDIGNYREQVGSAGIEPDLWISAKTGQGVEQLKTAIRESVGATDQSEGSFSARQRHTDALRGAVRHLEQGKAAYSNDSAAELLAEELRLAQQKLGEITGEYLPDDLLGAIFSSFCIGK